MCTASTGSVDNVQRDNCAPRDNDTEFQSTFRRAWKGPCPVSKLLRKYESSLSVGKSFPPSLFVEGFQAQRELFVSVTRVCKYSGETRRR